MFGSIFMHVFQFSVHYRSDRWAYVTDNRMKKKYYWFTALHTKIAYHNKIEDRALETRQKQFQRKCPNKNSLNCGVYRVAVIEPGDCK